MDQPYPLQVIQQAADLGMVVIGGLCVTFYLLLGFASLLNEKAEMRRNARLYGPREDRDEEEEEE